MHKLEKSVQLTLIIASSIIILAVLGAIFFNSTTSTANTIQVRGQAIEKVTPDVITVYFNVETTGTTSSDAQNANSLIVTKLKEGIIALGFSEKDLKTENFNIYPNYDYSKGTPISKGYKAIHSIKVELSEEQQSKLGSVIDAGAEAGAGISYINFELSPKLEQEYKTKAIKTASEDARTKVEAIASGFNKRVGKLVSVSLDEFNYYPWRAYESVSSDAAGISDAKLAVSSITPSEQEVSAYVTAIYKLN